MKELLDDFKVDLEKLMDDWYYTLEHLVDGALFNMSFYQGDPEEQFTMIQDVMMEVLQERLDFILKEDGESE